MRTIIVIAASTLALAACGRQSADKPASAATPAATAGSPMATLATGLPPARRAGLWEQTMVRDGVVGSLMSKVRMCTDAATEANMSLFGGRFGHDICQRRSVKRIPGGGYAYSSTCDLGQAGVTTSTGTLTGDFVNGYHLHSESDTSGAVSARSNGHHVTDITATYLGPCSAGMVPGDVVMANGMKVNVNKFGAAVGGGS